MNQGPCPPAGGRDTGPAFSWTSNICPDYLLCAPSTAIIPSSDVESGSQICRGSGGACPPESALQRPIRLPVGAGPTRGSPKEHLNPVTRWPGGLLIGGEVRKHCFMAATSLMGTSVCVWWGGGGGGGRQTVFTVKDRQLCLSNVLVILRKFTNIRK